MFGVSGSVLSWLVSYLSGLHNFVKQSEGQSNSVLSVVGVPQDSVLGPNLFSMYIAPIVNIAVSFGVCMLTIDNLYIKLNAENGCFNGVDALKNDAAAMSDWMLENGHALNPSKSDVIVFGTAQSLQASDTASLNSADIDAAVSDRVKSRLASRQASVLR